MTEGISPVPEGAAEWKAEDTERRSFRNDFDAIVAAAKPGITQKVDHGWTVFQIPIASPEEEGLIETHIYDGLVAKGYQLNRSQYSFSYYDRDNRAVIAPRFSNLGDHLEVTLQAIM